MKKRKKYYLIATIGLLIVGGLIIFRSLRTSPDNDIELETEKIGFTAELLSTPPKESKEIVYPKFTVGGSGTEGAILDHDGKLIWRATNESPAIGITISPSEQLIWVSGGDRRSYIISAEGKEIADIPIVPKGKDMLGFGQWIWLDNHRLLGDSGIQFFDENGKVVGCCGGDNVSESRFYVYDLRTKKMEEMLLPESLRGKAVSMGKVMKTGEFQLGHEGDGFSWYRVTELEK